jgi:RimJ/RimL family protein N-acetyltransferase
MMAVVQKLVAVQRPELLSHLLGLSAADRRLRFGALMQDEAVAHYVEGIDFARDKLFGIFGLDLHLVGMAHLALDRAQRFAELGLSVDADERGKGFGFALLQRAKLHAVNLGFRTLFMYCLSENKTMVHLARKAGLKVATEQGAVDAHLRLDPPNYGAIAQEAVEDQIALVDLFWKQQLQWLPHPVRAA